MKGKVFYLFRSTSLSPQPVVQLAGPRTADKASFWIACGVHPVAPKSASTGWLRCFPSTASASLGAIQGLVQSHYLTKLQNRHSRKNNLTPISFQYRLMNKGWSNLFFFQRASNTFSVVRKIIASSVFTSMLEHTYSNGTMPKKLAHVTE